MVQCDSRCALVGGGRRRSWATRSGPGRAPARRARPGSRRSDSKKNLNLSELSVGVRCCPTASAGDRDTGIRRRIGVFERDTRAPGCRPWTPNLEDAAASPRRHVVVSTPGGMKLRSHWQGKAAPDGGRVGRSTGRSGSPVTTFTPKARRQMRWVWNALPWEQLAG